MKSSSTPFKERTIFARTTYTIADFQRKVLSVTRQTKPILALPDAAFGTNTTWLDTWKKDELFREEIVKGGMAFSIQLYFTNLFVTMGCMDKGPYQVDIVNWAVDNMDPDIRAETESQYNGHLKPRSRDKFTQGMAM